MRIIENKIIPFKGFNAINLFGFLFTRKKANISPSTQNHEQIHTEQMKELLYIPFYLIYMTEYLVKLLVYRNFLQAYFNISFEREAYQFQNDHDYLNRRKNYYWIKRILH